jgi:serine/threonine protein kinase
MYELAQGQKLNERFTLLRPLGRGGMGEVWLVDDNELEEQLVAKIVPPDASEEHVQLLRRECRHARRLVHPHIVPVYEFHRGDEVSFITMAHVEGEDLGRFRGKSPDEIVELVSPIADALDYAHRQGVVHRDLKVSNILVDEQGQPRLLDFGIAGLLEPEPGELTLSGGGSRYSMSPQQADGEAPQPADDIYAFGVLLYELVTGEPPFWPDITRDRIRSEAPAPMTSTYRLPEMLRSLVSDLLKKTPGERPPDMGAVKSALKVVARDLGGEVIETPVVAKKDVTLQPPPRVGVSSRVSPQAFHPINDASGRPARPSPITERSPESLRRSSLGWPTVALFSVLLLVAAFVVFYLPNWVDEKDAATQSEPSAAESEAGMESDLHATPQEVTASSIENLEEQAFAESQAEQVLERVLRQKDALESNGASSWGGEDFRRALKSIAEGNAHFESKDYDRATSAYEQAGQYLREVRSNAQSILREALDLGRRALASGDAEASAEAFRLATTIEPGNAEAKTGLARARVLNDVLMLVAQGEEYERRGDLPRATESYKKAAQLDSLSRPVQLALARVDESATERAFQSAMSEGIAALERKDYEAARKAFQQANAIRPNAPGIADGLAQVEEGHRLDMIALHREKALTFEEQEDWHQASEQYRKVLDLDATVQFAQLGKQRADERADLSDRLEFHIKNPGRLSDRRVLEEAATILDTAKAIAPTGPKLQQQVAGLGELVAKMSVPIRVELVSDGETDVIIYRVGRLGPFERHAMDLRPGTYTVVGTRKGYRDVRLQLAVVAGKKPEPLVVRCKEKI